MLRIRLSLLLCLLPCFVHATLDIDTTRYDEAEVKWLEPAGQPRTLALMKPALRPISRGTAIIVPDLGKNIATPSVVPAQRQHLPHYGLNTIAISPPSWPDTPSKDSLHEIEQQLIARVNAALELAATTPGPSLLVAEGVSAALLGKALSEEAFEEEVIKVVVLVSPYLPEDKLNRKMADWLSRIFLPYLDVISQFDNRWVIQADTLRQDTTKTQFLPHYRRAELRLRLSEQDEQDQLSRLIHGWMRTSGW